MSDKIKGMQSRAKWKHFRNEIKSGASEIIFRDGACSCEGTYVMEACIHRHILPVGWLWFRHETGNVISITECFVPEHLRKAGIMSAMLKNIEEWYPNNRMVVTGRLTKFSFALFQSKGFVFNEVLGRWEKESPKTTSLKEKKS